MRGPGADAIPLAISGATSGTIMTGRGLFLGWLLRETGGAAALTVEFRDGSATAGYIVGEGTVAISGVDRFFFPVPAIQTVNQLTFQSIGTGVVVGSAIVIPETRLIEWLIDREQHGAVGAYTHNWPEEALLYGLER